ncbi:6-phosphogluconolactonase [Aromatoleum diolicum]|uniref:6-phosphogluconolactonase n=1 Tax=Aromatoleum diolicum TaxID=75796 RepID=A0ABX1QIG9_9RHOO|nr:6-phosphogluconolactonase [Aromatoleum diolicum]NMG76901.1 6-phosphogluconolactonase [Aromatoleum diolicum]
MGANSRLALPSHVGQSLFDDERSMAAALADRVAAMLRHALGQRRTASLVVSGGRSPLPFLRALAHRDLDWPRVSVTLADERWLPPEHPDSNAGMVQASLLQGPAAAARFVPLYGGEDSPEAGLAACELRCAELSRPFDVVVLGMGEDGHFASLFPGVPGLSSLLAENGPSLAAVNPPGASHPRMTFSHAALLDARQLLVQIHGPRKRAVIEEAAARGDADLQPIAALLQQTRTPVQVFFSPAD